MSHSPSSSGAMLTRPAASAGSEAIRVSTETAPRLAADADPAVTVERILALLRDDLYLPARRLASEALKRFPDHHRTQWAWSIFERRGRSRIGNGGPEPGRDKEFEWLRNPPDWARGKWVALVGSEVVAAGDTLAEVAAALRGRTFSSRPLAHRIA